MTDSTASIISDNLDSGSCYWSWAMPAFTMPGEKPNTAPPSVPASTLARAAAAPSTWSRTGVPERRKDRETRQRAAEERDRRQCHRGKQHRRVPHQADAARGIQCRGRRAGGPCAIASAVYRRKKAIRSLSAGPGSPTADIVPSPSHSRQFSATAAAR